MRIHHASQNFFLQGPAGRIEAILWIPTRASTPELAAVLCHPHPLFGGTMHNKVVYQMGKSLDAIGIPVLRFNFRGAGLSAGTHDAGTGETEDVKAAIDFIATQFPEIPLLIGGFSFGSWVGLRVGCGDVRVTELFGVGIPVNNSNFEFLESCAKPKLIVQGTKDEHGAWHKVEQLGSRLSNGTQLIPVQDADHFLAGHLDELDRALSNWLMERHPTLRRL